MQARHSQQSPSGDKTPAMLQGQMEHLYIVEGPDAFYGEVDLKPDSCHVCKNTAVKYREDAEGNRQWACGVHGKGQEWRKPRLSVDEKEFRRIQGMRDAVAGRSDCEFIGWPGEEEVTLVCEEEAEVEGEAVSFKCRARLDWLRETPTGWLIADLKRMSKAATVKNCKAVIADYKLDFQAACYLRWAQLLGLGECEWYWVFVEAKAPHDVCVMRMDDWTRRQAAVDVATALMTWAKCLRTDEWPGRYTEATEGGLPDWAMASRS